LPDTYLSGDDDPKRNSQFLVGDTVRERRGRLRQSIQTENPLVTFSMPDGKTQCLVKSAFWAQTLYVTVTRLYNLIQYVFAQYRTLNAF
jgi:hypothetical protein